MKIDRAGVPFIATALVPAGALAAMRRPVGALCAAALAGCFAFFFRDPDRQTSTQPGAVVAPADGRVMYAGTGQAGVAPQGEWQQISIFLSPLDVHVNRIPVGGRVLAITHRPGRFLPAYAPESGAENESCEVRIDHDGELVICRQVVGLLARRVVCRLVPGMEVNTGERFGIMKFGSRMDVFLPPSARVHVSVGDVVRGGETIVATLVHAMRDGRAGRS